MPAWFSPFEWTRSTTVLLLLAASWAAQAQTATPKKTPSAKVKSSKTSPAPVQPPPTALTQAELDLAARIDTGPIACDAGKSITLTAADQAPGYFELTFEGQRHRLHPVSTHTGTLRLEDAASGAVWLQLPSKSMLMHQRLGRRLADGCMSEAQKAAAQAEAQTAPTQPAASLLDAPSPPPSR